MLNCPGLSVMGVVFYLPYSSSEYNSNIYLIKCIASCLPPLVLQLNLNIFA